MQLNAYVSEMLSIPNIPSIINIRHPKMVYNPFRCYHICIHVETGQNYFQQDTKVDLAYLSGFVRNNDRFSTVWLMPQ